MSHWSEAVVTDSGVEMLNEWMAGRTITITSAYGGTGTVDPELLTEQTGLVDSQQKLCLLGEKNGPEGKTVQVQVSNAEVPKEYELNQVGVFAKLDAERDPDAEERLLFLMQDQQGVTIPSMNEAGFLLELYCLIGITNNGRFEVRVDSAGLVTAAGLRDALARAIAEHNADPEAHPALRDLIGTVSEAGVRMETNLADVDARLSQLELMYSTDVRGNPFAVTFETLDGVEAAGVWNQPQARVEF